VTKSLRRHPSKVNGDDMTIRPRATRHRTRPHAADDALRVLADPSSVHLRRPLVDAIFAIGIGDTADASSAEWALLDLARLMLGFEGR
jgi:hypothetical protein